MKYITIDGDDIGQKITSSYLKNDVAALKDINRIVQEKTTEISVYLKSLGFEIIFCAADGVAGYTENSTISDENLYESIKEIASPSISFSCGVGETLQESYIALLSAKSNGKSCLHNYMSLNQL